MAKQGGGNNPWVGFDDLWQKYVQAEKRKVTIQKERQEKLRLKKYRWMKNEERRRKRGTELKEDGWTKGDSLAKEKRTIRFYEIEDRSTFKLWRHYVKLPMFEVKNIKIMCDGKRVKVLAEKKDKEGTVENRFAWVFEPYPWVNANQVAAAWNPRRGILILEAPKRNPLGCKIYYRPIRVKRG